MAKFRLQPADRELKMKYRAFNKGAKQFTARVQVTHLDIMNQHSQQSKTDDLSMATLDSEEVPTAIWEQEVREFQTTLELLSDGGVGYLPETKHNGRVRLYFENWNSLGLFTQRWKLDKLNETIKHLAVDVVAGCESQVDWSYVPHNK